MKVKIAQAMLNIIGRDMNKMKTWEHVKGYYWLIRPLAYIVSEDCKRHGEEGFVTVDSIDGSNKTFYTRTLS